MQQHNAWQIHANVNVIGSDAALRVTVSRYDENGDLKATQTWRRHITSIDIDGLAWQGLLGCQDLTKMMADACQAPATIEGVDEPLF